MIEAHVREAFVAALGDRIQFDVPMSRHTSLRIGGSSDALATPASPDELVHLLRLCAEHDVPHTILGNGFNTLVRDGGIEGVTIKSTRLRRLESIAPGLLLAEAGVSHASLMKHCVSEGLTGLEFGAGIPGTVGGWVAMNAGIGTREAKDVVREVEVIGPRGEERRSVGRDALRFAYRSLSGLEAGSVILSVVFEVGSSDSAKVEAEVKRLLALRSGSQPLDVPTCGSVFKNPEGDFAGRLIEAAGLKGEREGSAQISPCHANFIANLGGATATDVLRLIARVQEQIESTSGIRLETEVRILGRDPA